MADPTPKLGLPKPVPNVETDWAFRLNEGLDILDDAMLTTNVSGVGSITVTDDGSGNVTISGTDEVGEGSSIPNALVGSDGITVTSGDPTDDIAGFRGEFINASGTLQTDIDTNTTNIATNVSDIVDNTTLITTTSGHLQSEIDAVEAGDVDDVNSVVGSVTVAGAGEVSVTTAGQIITISGTDHSDASVTLQEAYDNGDGTIASTTSKPVQTGDLTVTGSIGIGLDEPQSKLHILDSTDARISLMEGESAGADVWYDGAANLFKIDTGTGGAGSQTNRIAIQRDTGDVGIGVAPGAAKLDVGGRIRGARIVSDVTTTASDVSFILAGANGLGMFTPGSSTVAFATQGIERMRIDSSGNVGIGTVNPANKLQVSGTISSQVVGQAILELENTTPNGEKFSIKSLVHGSVAALAIGSETTSEILTLEDTGFVGIGVDNPETLLHLKAGSTTLLIESTVTSSVARLQFQAESGGAGSLAMYDNTYAAVPEYAGKLVAQTFNEPIALSAYGPSGEIHFYTGGRTANEKRFVVDSSGNVGIGTAIPSSKLEVVGDVLAGDLTVTGTLHVLDPGVITHPIFESNVGGVLIDIDKSSSSQDAKIIFKTAGATNFEIGVDSTPVNTFKIGTANNVAEFVMTPAGNVGIGTTAPSERLDVVGSGIFSGDLTAASGTFTDGITTPTINEDTEFTGKIFTVPSTLVLGEIQIGPSDDTDRGISFRHTGGGTRVIDFVVDGTRVMGVDNNTGGRVRSLLYATFGAGSAGTPVYQLNETDTGMYSPGTNQLGFSAGGTETLTISGVNDQTDGVGIDGNLTVTGDVGADVGSFDTSLTVSGIPVSVGVDTSVTLQEAYDNGDGTIASTSSKPVQTGDLTVTGTLSIADGIDEDTPGLSFTSDPDTGIYKSGSNELSITAAGNQAARFGLGFVQLFGDILAKTGSQFDPAYTFIGNTTTGLFSKATSVIGITADATERMTVSGVGDSTDGVGIVDNLTVGGDISADNVLVGEGLIGAPSIAFADAPGTGMWKTAGVSDIIDFSLDGVRALRIRDNSILSFGRPFWTNTAGTAGVPSFSFLTNTQTGMFNKSAGVLGFSAGATETLTVSGVNDETDGVGIEGNLTVTATVAADSGTFDNSLTVSGIPVSIGVDSSVTLQEAYDNGDGIITTTAGQPVVISGAGEFEAGNITVTGTLTLQDSTSAINPSFNFAGDSDTGLFHSGENAMKFTTGGDKRFTISNDKLIANVPYLTFRTTHALIPDYSFKGDEDTGMYRRGNDLLAFTAGGTETLTISGVNDQTDGVGIKGNLTVTGTIAGKVGSFDTALNMGSSDAGALGVNTSFIYAGGDASTPGYSWLGDTDTGIAHGTSGDTMLYRCGNSNVMQHTNSIIQSYKVHRFKTNGTATAPSIQFISNTDTGLYQLVDGDASVAFTTSGTAAGHFDAEQNFHVTNDIIAGGKFFADDGLQGQPGFSFTDDTTTGMFRHSAGVLRFSAGGAAGLELQASFLKALLPFSLQAGGGSAANPLLNFISDTNTGLYQIVSADNSLAFATAGTGAGHFDASQNFHANADVLASGTVSGTALNIVGDATITDGQILADDGSVSLPSYSFANDPDSGISIVPNSVMNFSFKGINQMRISATDIRMFDRLLIASNTGASDPAITFSHDTDTGIFTTTTADDNILRFATGGVEAGNFDANQDLHVTNTLQAATISGATSTFGVDNDQTNFLDPQMSFVPDSTQGDKKSGFGYNYGAHYPFMIANDNIAQFWTSGYTAIFKQLRVYTWAPQDVSTPAFSFQQDPDTGMFQIVNGGDDNLRFATSGTEAGRFDEVQNFHVTNDVLAGGTVSGTALNLVGDATITDGRILSDNASQTAPAYSFTNDDNAGLYLKTPGIVNMSVGGAVVYQWSQTLNFCNVRMRIQANSTADNPAIQFIGDSDTGIWQDINDISKLNFAAGAINRVTISGLNDETDGMGIDGNLTVTGTVGADAGSFGTGLTISGVPVATGAVVDEGQIVFLAQMFG